MAVVNYPPKMSVSELKRAVDALSLDEQLELADYLHRRSRESDRNWEVELARRLDSSIKGEGHSRDELMELHERLSADGR